MMTTECCLRLNWQRHKSVGRNKKPPSIRSMWQALVSSTKFEQKKSVALYFMTLRLHPSSLELDLLWKKVEDVMVWKAWGKRQRFVHTIYELVRWRKAGRIWIIWLMNKTFWITRYKYRWWQLNVTSMFYRVLSKYDCVCLSILDVCK